MLNEQRQMNYLIILFITIFLIWAIPLFAQEAIADIPSKNFDAADISLEELLNVEVEVASLFAENELVVGSAVSSITSDKWKRLGARRFTDALSNELSVVTYYNIAGSNALAIRGYASDSSNKGTAYLIDGIPLNAYMTGDIIYLPDFGLGTLDRIELIKGPGSAIYGSDAFHGVVSMKTFESDTDHYSIEMAGAYPLYGDANVKMSQGFADDLFRINMSASTSGQRPQKEEYKYDYVGGINAIVFNTLDAKGTGERERSYKSHTGVLKLDINPADKLKIKLGSYINTGVFKEYPGTVTKFEIGSLKEFDTSSQETLAILAKSSAAYTFSNRISIETSGYYTRYNQESEIRADFFGSKSYVYAQGSRSGANLIIKQPDNAINLQWLLAYSFIYMKVDSASNKYQNWNPNIPSFHPIDPTLEIGEVKPEEDEAYSGEDRTINSVYAQTKWAIIENTLYLLLGGRLDNYSDFGNQITPRGGLIFQPTSKSSIKALYGRAFRAPTAMEEFGIMNYLGENKDLKPETIDIYELILMYIDKKLKATVNGFYSNWENGIITEISFDPHYVNEGKNISYGIEGSIFYNIKPLALKLGFSYIKSTALDAKKDSMNPSSSETIDRDYVAFPGYSAIAGLYYTLDPYDITFYLNNKLYFKMKGSHYNFVYRDEPNDLSLYWRTDLNINKAIDDKAEIILDVKNLFNRKNYMPLLYGAVDGNEEPGISVLLRAGYKL